MPKKSEPERPASLAVRIGYGWDSHEFKRGIPLKIGGVTLHTQDEMIGRATLHCFNDAIVRTSRYHAQAISCLFY